MTDQIRISEPSYMARYRATEQARRDAEADGAEPDESLPLYLRHYRAKGAPGDRPSNITDAEVPLWQRSSLEVQRSLTEDSRNKEISAPLDAELRLANDVFLIRHGGGRSRSVLVHVRHEQGHAGLSGFSARPPALPGGCRFSSCHHRLSDGFTGRSQRLRVSLTIWRRARDRRRDDFSINLTT
jgi:hypothetical protein